MGYCFKKDGAEDFYIRLCDTGTVRAAACNVGFLQFMPDTERDGRGIPKEAVHVLVVEFREQAKVLNKLADYMDNANNLRWDH